MATEGLRLKGREKAVLLLHLIQTFYIWDPHYRMPIIDPVMEPTTEKTEPHYDGGNNSHNSSHQKKMPPWRIAWVGITLAALLWIAPNIYFKKSQQFTEVELQAGSMSQPDYEAIILSHARYSIACKIIAAVLLLASILYLISQLDMRPKPRQITEHSK